LGKAECRKASSGAWEIALLPREIGSMPNNQEIGPLILISGSAEPGRNDYKPPIPDANAAAAAAERIGAALANAACRIAVFSAEPRFMKAAVVHGFVNALGAKAKKKGLVQVRAPATAPVPFPERVKNPDVFIDMPDQYDHWIRSFLRASRDADGVVLIGGGRSTLVMGHIALAFHLPTLPLAGFGGAAQDIWKSIRPGDDLPTAGECQVMVERNVTDAHATELVAVLLAQRQRRTDQANAAADAERMRKRWLTTRAVAGVAVLIAAALLGSGASLLDQTSGWRQLALYMIGPLGGCAAALVGSSILDDPPRTTLHTGLLGFFAGFLAALLYLLALISSGKDATKVQTIALWFALGTGIAAGFAAERVLRDWASGRVHLPGGAKSRS
jgi:hypothetical protein